MALLRLLARPCSWLNPVGGYTAATAGSDVPRALREPVPASKAANRSRRCANAPWAGPAAPVRQSSASAPEARPRDEYDRMTRSANRQRQCEAFHISGRTRSHAVIAPSHSLRRCDGSGALQPRRVPAWPVACIQAVKSLIVVLGPFFLTEATPVARLASEAYIWLLPMT